MPGEPKPMTEADRIRAEIEEQNKKFLEHKALVSQIIPPKATMESTYVPIEKRL